MGALGRAAIRYRWLVVAIWVLAAVGLFAAGRAAGSDFRSDFQLPGTQTQTVLDLLKKVDNSQAGDSDTLVVRADGARVTDPDVQRRVAGMLAAVARSPHVLSVDSPYFDPAAAQAAARARLGPAAPDQAVQRLVDQDRARAAGQVSRDGTIGYATVRFDQPANKLPRADVQRVWDLATAARTDTVHIEGGGAAFQRVTTSEGAGASELIGILAAAVILYVAFGSLPAMLLPLITAVLALLSGQGIISLLSHPVAIADFAPYLASLMVLGVGIDYALFIVTRHRRNLRAGMPVAESIEVAVNTSGRAVLFAGLTVVIALLGLIVLGVSFLVGVAIAAALCVALTMIASLTLLPALLAIFGVRVLSRRQRRALAAGRLAGHDGLWARWSTAVGRRPVLPAVLALGVMVALALPAFSLRLGFPDAGNDSAASTTRKAYDLLAAGFGPGFNGPVTIVTETRGEATADLQRLADAVRADPGIAGVQPPRPVPGTDLAMITAYPNSAPQDEATSRTIDRLRGQVLPAATAGNVTRAYTYGTVSITKDFATVLSNAMPLFFAVVVGLSFLLLLVAFRSLLIPLTAAVMNLFAAGAAFGLLVAVFQWGWLSDLIGIGRAGPIAPFLPVMLFAILFGLSMDYQVFLVSRMHEEWVHSRDNRRAIRVGQSATGGIITAAAGIMICVFGAFVLVPDLVTKAFGIGLAGAVFLDAFVLRTVLVPAAMHLFGSANWWLPRPLERILPNLALEAPAGPDREPVAIDGEPAAAR
jgi:RND superfamily putative drug exporter